MAVLVVVCCLLLCRATLCLRSLQNSDYINTQHVLLCCLYVSKGLSGQDINICKNIIMFYPLFCNKTMLKTNDGNKKQNKLTMKKVSPKLIHLRVSGLCWFFGFATFWGNQRLS